MEFAGFFGPFSNQPTSISIFHLHGSFVIDNNCASHPYFQKKLIFSLGPGVYGENSPWGFAGLKHDYKQLK